MIRATIAPALALLAACAAVPGAPIVANGPPAPAGSLVALNQPVQVGTLIATPKEVIEDSRCPENARCVWAGRLVVSTRIDGAGWRETVPLTLGQTHTTHGTAITLVAGHPEARADRQVEPLDYRFGYTGSD